MNEQPASSPGTGSSPPDEPVVEERAAEPAADPEAGQAPAAEAPAEQAPAESPGGGFSLIKAFGGWGGMADAGLPSIAFVAVYTAFDRDLRLALTTALALGGVLAIVRIVRRDPLQNVIGGFLGLGLAAYIANKTGKAEDFYLPGLFINAGYAVAYLIANLVRWPLIGLIVGLAAGWGVAWRKDPVLLRAFVRAGWLWVGLFCVKLAIQLPLYLTGEVVALGIARVATGWPLWLVTLWLTYVVVKGSVPHSKWGEFKNATENLARKPPARTK